ncbi:MAG: hypothetical protein HRT89_24530 [Lentisphaeria bacterium]|nr:hypothetical protein [Lentisphaeria bacterium]NQZ71224.1 hypothetical protein [Lentisphaeria bacterium]
MSYEKHKVLRKQQSEQRRKDEIKRCSVYAACALVLLVSGSSMLMPLAFGVSLVALYFIFHLGATKHS